MGIRSQVGIALKADIAEEILKAHPWVKDESDEQHSSEEGCLFIFDDIKWYVLDDPEIAALYNDLMVKPDSFLIREACPEYPDSEDGNIGEWDDNPWDLRKHVSVELIYEGE